VIELRGGAFAQAFAALVAALTPVLMSFGTKVTTDSVGLVVWPLAALYLLRIVNGADPRWWLAIGTLLGIGVESKYSLVFFAFALVVALLLLPQRRALFTWWFPCGILLAIVLTLPNAIWEAQHGYPMWSLLHDADQYKNTALSPLQYVATQLLITHPLLAPVWLIGVITLLRRPDARFLSVAYIVLIVEMIAFHAKHYYPGDVYPIPIAAGAVTIEAWTRRATLWRPVLAGYAFVCGILLVPLILPVLPERTMTAYDGIAQSFFQREVNIARAERTDIGNLPPDLADMHGWPELAAEVAGIYQSLPPARRAKAAIFASNYGEAAAIDFFGSRYGLPPTLSAHNQYWLWGTRGYGVTS
jgi:hypothetical protein